MISPPYFSDEAIPLKREDIAAILKFLPKFEKPYFSPGAMRPGMDKCGNRCERQLDGKRAI